MAINILVVDDSATMRSIVTRALTMSDLPVGQIHQAANGQEGLDLLDQEWVDVALVNINMPVMNGLEMIERVRAKPGFADFPVVVVSTESSQTRIEEVRSKGVEFVHKPFTPELLNDVLRTIMKDLDDEGE